MIEQMIDMLAVAARGLPSEETELVIKILELSGILIKDLGLYQVFNAEEQEQIQQEKS